jgi:hypothetical protein
VKFSIIVNNENAKCNHKKDLLHKPSVDCGRKNDAKLRHDCENDGTRANAGRIATIS